MQIPVETVNIEIYKQEMLINLQHNHVRMAQPTPKFCVVQGKQWQPNFDIETNLLDS